MMIRFLRQLRIFFGIRRPHPVGIKLLFSSQTHSCRQAQIAVRILYGLQLLIALRTLPQWGGMIERQGILPLWPVSWMSVFPSSTAIAAVLGLFLIGSISGALLPRYRWSRVLAFIGLFQFIAWHNSYGKIGHSLHVLLFIVFILMFLPSGWQRRDSSRRVRQQTLFTYWSAQAVPLIAYSMAGLIKIGCGLYQLAVGQASVFGPEGLPRHVADRLLQTGAETPLGPWVIEHPWLVMPGMWVTLYLELFAIVALFRPSTRIVFVAGLFVFHVASYFTMTIWFPENCLLLVLLMLGLPACRESCWNLKRSLLDLPLVSLLHSRLNTR
jgi:hypothetical protein